MKITNTFKNHLLNILFIIWLGFLGGLSLFTFLVTKEVVSPSHDKTFSTTNEQVYLEDSIVATNNTLQTNLVTNIVSSFDISPDGRITRRIKIIKHFNTDEVFSLPYSPNEFIVKTTNGIFHVCFGPNDLENINFFKIFGP